MRPFLHSLPWQGPHTVLDVQDIPAESLGRLALIALPLYALTLVPAHLAFLFVSTRRSWQPWFCQNGKAAYFAALMTEFIVAGWLTDLLIWRELHRVTVWSPMSITMSTACDILAQSIGVRGRCPVCARLLLTLHSL